MLKIVLRISAIRMATIENRNFFLLRLTKKAAKSKGSKGAMTKSCGRDSLLMSSTLRRESSTINHVNAARKSVRRIQFSAFCIVKCNKNGAREPHFESFYYEFISSLSLTGFRKMILSSKTSRTMFLLLSILFPKIAFESSFITSF